MVLVLDDYHAINELAIHETIAFLLERQPAHLHLVIATRQDPPLPISRLRGRGQITEIRQRELRFTAEDDLPPSQQVLERVEAANLFLVPLDEERTWYRYHHLFADLPTSGKEQYLSRVMWWHIPFIPLVIPRIIPLG